MASICTEEGLPVLRFPLFRAAFLAFFRGGKQGKTAPCCFYSSHDAERREMCLIKRNKGNTGLETGPEWPVGWPGKSRGAGTWRNWGNHMQSATRGGGDVSVSGIHLLIQKLPPEDFCRRRE